jgi:hypothetical protein
MEQWMFWVALAAFIIVNAAAIMLAGFFKSYGEKKGENLATHEDIEGLANQVRVMTKVTEDIKAQVSNEQREWNFKKDLLRKVTGQIAELQRQSIAVVRLTRSALNAVAERDRMKINEARADAVQNFNDGLAAFSTTKMLMDVMFSREVNEQAGKTMEVLESMAVLKRGMNEHQVREHSDEVNKTMERLIELLRKEMVSIQSG